MTTCQLLRGGGEPIVRKSLLLLGIALFLSIGASAQSPAGAGSISSNRDNPWQLAVGYQYNRINLTGTPFNTNGMNTSLAYFPINWLGLEGEVGAGFGNTNTTLRPPNLTAKSVFAGGGARLAYPGQHRIEPWIHGVVGMEHFRFTQTALLGDTTALAWLAGGGVDYSLGPYVALRAQADVLWTDLYSGNQRNFQAIGGIVFKF